MIPSLELALSAFDLEDPQPLGGRVRKHWCALRRGEEFVLTRYRENEASVRYEIAALASVAGLDWPVPVALDGPISVGGSWWSLASLLPGRAPVGDDEPGRRGRLLAEFHASVRALPPPESQRPGFRRAERVLSDPRIEATLRRLERRLPEEVGIVRWHLDRARERLQGIDLSARKGQLVHGDFTAWNLRFEEDRLTAILDFELAHEDHRVAEFAHAWRGKYDAVVHAYDEVLPLEPVEWAMLTPVWWLFLVDLWCGSAPDDPWILAKLRQRSALMGPDRDAFP